MKRAMISFPKSGRTWLRVMLDDLGIDLEYSHANSGHKYPVPIEQLDTQLADDFDRIVFLHRDPRDTAVSGYYQKSKRRDGYRGTISDFIRDPLHGVEKITRFNRMWLDLAAKSPKIFAVSYEELRRDPLPNLRRIIEFLGEERSDGRIADVIESNTFEKMQAREREGVYKDKYGDILSPKNPDDPDSFKVRRGKIGGYRDELNPIDVVYCDKVVARLTNKAIRSSPAPLPLCQHLFAQLNSRGIRYSHWKSTIRLDRSLAGLTDLDLLVHEEDWDEFVDLIRQHGFVAMLNPPEKIINGMVDYLGFDDETGALAHLHLHRKLILGTRTVKNIHLPIEHLFWSHRSEQVGVVVPDPALELYILLLRAMLKLKSDLKRPNAIDWLPRDIVDEIATLYERAGRDQLLDIAAEAGLPIDSGELVKLAEAIQSERISADGLLRAHRAVIEVLRPYAFRPAVGALGQWASRIADVLAGVLPNVRGKKRLADEGRCFALIGADGSGKSTLVKDLNAWLSWKLRCQRLYLGLPKQSRPYRWFQTIEQLAKKRRRKQDGRRRRRMWEAIGSACRALRFYHAARYRRRQTRRINRLIKRGTIVLCDRFPMTELSASDFSMDGPRIAFECGKRLHWLASLEQRIYRNMPRSDMAIVLRTDPDVLRQRKQDLPQDIQTRKAELVNAIPPGDRVIIIDNNREYSVVVRDIKQQLWAILTNQRRSPEKPTAEPSHTATAVGAI